jgi:hypothetical protein
MSLFIFSYVSSSAGFGGLIYYHSNSDGLFSLSNGITGRVVITNNTCLGGGIFTTGYDKVTFENSGGFISIKQSTFEFIQDANIGGGIYFDALSYSIQSQLQTISFRSLYAASYGGAIFVKGGTNQVPLSYCTFVNNTGSDAE